MWFYDTKFEVKISTLNSQNRMSINDKHARNVMWSNATCVVRIPPVMMRIGWKISNFNYVLSFLNRVRRWPLVGEFDGENFHPAEHFLRQSNVLSTARLLNRMKARKLSAASGSHWWRKIRWRIEEVFIFLLLWCCSYLLPPLNWFFFVIFDVPPQTPLPPPRTIEPSF